MVVVVDAATADVVVDGGGGGEGSMLVGDRRPLVEPAAMDSASPLESFGSGASFLGRILLTVDPPILKKKISKNNI